MVARERRHELVPDLALADVVRRGRQVDDQRSPIARRRVPKIAWDFLDGGAEDNLTLDNNREVFKRIRFPKPDDGSVSASFPFVFVNAGG